MDGCGWTKGVMFTQWLNGVQRPVTTKMGVVNVCGRDKVFWNDSRNEERKDEQVDFVGFRAVIFFCSKEIFGIILIYVTKKELVCHSVTLVVC